MTTRQVSKNGENGFSMVEVVVAMAILAIGMLAAFTMQFNSVRNNTTGNIITQANMLAKAQLEFLKGQDLSALAAGSYSDAALLDETGQPGGIYDRSWTITDLGTSARRITVTVQWQRRGKSGTVFFSSNTRGNGV